MPFEHHTRTIHRHTAVCDCCPAGRHGGPRVSGYHPTYEALMEVLRRMGWDLDYEPLGLVACPECKEAGRTPSVDEDLKLATAPEPEEADVARFVSEGGSWSEPL